MNLLFYQGTTSGLEFLFFPEFDLVKHGPEKGAPTVSPFTKQFSLLTKSLCEMLETYSKVSFNLVDIREQMSMSHAIMRIDKANNFFDQEFRLNNS